MARPDRIKAHVLACLLVYLVKRIMEQIMALVGEKQAVAATIFNQFSIELNKQGFSDGKVNRKW
ncbi:MAG: hypothetical protein QXT39_02560 [Conexivisphaerales archaeon]